MIRFSLIQIFEVNDLLPQEQLDQPLCAAIVSGGERVSQEATYRRNKLKEN